MIVEKYSVIVSPEVLNGDVFLETYDVNNFGVYSGMSYVLSGGTNGSSLLTDLTIPIMMTQSFNDLGIYDEFFIIWGSNKPL